MKMHPFYPLKRFLSILILDKDIVKETLEETEVQQPESTIHPLFLQTLEPENAPISIQPEELGGIENINTRIFADDESIAPLFEEEDADEEESPFPPIPQQLEDLTNKESDSTPEEDFYDYAMSDIPVSILSEDSPEIEEPVRKNDKFVSLRDVLIERGNFWQDKSKKVENIWERDPNMPEEEMVINDTMVVGDVLPPDVITSPEPIEPKVKKPKKEVR